MDTRPHFLILEHSTKHKLNTLLSENVTGRQIASMAEGRQFTIIEGPVCAGGLTWWKLETFDGEIAGWSAGSILPDIYLIQPDS